MTAANFEECGLNNTAGQTEQDSELGLQFPSRGEQFAAAGGGDPWEQEPQCRCVCVGGGGGAEEGRAGPPRPPSSPRGMHSEPWQQAGDQEARSGRGGYSHSEAGLTVANWATLKSGGISLEDWIYPEPGGLSPGQMVGNSGGAAWTPSTPPPHRGPGVGVPQTQE